MDKINFIIPDQEKLLIFKNETNYVKINTNIYKFINKYETNIDTLINTLYDTALLLKYNNNINESIIFFKECEKQIQTTNNKDLLELYYEIYINLALLTNQTTNNYNIINNYYLLAINICPDKAEPYYYLSMYCTKIKKYEKSYNLLHKALNCSYESIKNKYKNVDIKCYGKYLYLELSEICYLLKKYDEGIQYLNKIKDDNDFLYIQEIITNKINMYKTIYY